MSELKKKAATLEEELENVKDQKLYYRRNRTLNKEKEELQEIIANLRDELDQMRRLKDVSQVKLKSEQSQKSKLKKEK